MSPALPPARRVLLTLFWVPVGFAVTLLLAAAAPLVIGHHSYVVESGSMSPAIETGDVVVVTPVTPEQVQVGEVITFRDPTHDGLITHRVVAIDPKRDSFAFVTQGDANTGREEWNIERGGDLGLVAYKVPKLGFVVSWIGSPGGRIGLVIVPALLLGLSLLLRIWTGDRGGRRVDESYG